MNYFVGNVSFVGCLSNTDDSILRVPFEHGFQVSKISQTEAIDLIAGIEGTTARGYIQERLFTSGALNMLHPDVVYVVTKDLGFEMSTLSEDSLQKMSAFNKDDLEGYLERRLNFLRLYRGNPRLCLYYIYHRYNDEITKQLGKSAYLLLWHHQNNSQPEFFTLKDHEEEELLTLLKTRTGSSDDKTVDLALRNFDESFLSENQNVAFLLLMISLECLFNDGQGEIAYKLSRGAAVLAGTTIDSSKKLFKRLRAFYTKRSLLVHNGACEIGLDELFELRGYVRQCLRKYLDIGKSKLDILESIKMSGYRDKLF